MAQLQTLDGQPLTWAELEERNARYWATHESDGTLTPVLRALMLSWACATRRHSSCGGHAWRDRDAPCPCACHAVSSVHVG